MKNGFFCPKCNNELHSGAIGSVCVFCGWQSINGEEPLMYPIEKLQRKKRIEPSRVEQIIKTVIKRTE